MEDFEDVYTRHIYVKKFSQVDGILYILVKKVLAYKIREVWVVNPLTKVMETVRVIWAIEVVSSVFRNGLVAYHKSVQETLHYKVCLQQHWIGPHCCQMEPDEADGLSRLENWSVLMQ